METFGQRAVGEILDDPRGLAPIDPEGAHQLLLRQAVELSRGRGDGEVPAKAVGW